jgi:hypothetical protein
MAIRALVSDTGLLARICTANQARALLEAALPVSAAISTFAKDRVSVGKALAASTAIIETVDHLQKTYPGGGDITSADARRVVSLASSVDQMLEIDEATENNAPVRDAGQRFYDALRLANKSGTCRKRPAERRRFKWWIIPLVLIGTTLVVYSETKGRKKS